MVHEMLKNCLRAIHSYWPRIRTAPGKRNNPTRCLKENSSRLLKGVSFERHWAIISSVKTQPLCFSYAFLTFTTSPFPVLPILSSWIASGWVAHGQCGWTRQYRKGEKQKFPPSYQKENNICAFLAIWCLSLSSNADRADGELETLLNNVLILRLSKYTCTLYIYTVAYFLSRSMCW